MANGTAVQSSVPEQEQPVDLDHQDDVDALRPEPDDHDADAATESRAREMGWKPLAEYRGPPGKWQPAADFITRGESILPIVRDQNRRLTERVGKLEGEISGLRSTSEEQLKIIKDLRDMGARADQRGYDRAMVEIKSKQRQAVEVGDTKAYDQLVEQAEALASARPVVPEVEPPKPPAAAPTPQVSEATKAFLDGNPWFRSDAFLNRKMIDRHIDVIQEGQIIDEAEQYTEAKRRLQEEYPERFGLPPVAPQQRQRAPARRAASVATPTAQEPAGPVPGAGLTKIEQIQDPAERAQARDAFNRTRRQLPDYTEAEYMALYADPHSDVLTLQKPRSQPNGR